MSIGKKIKTIRIIKGIEIKDISNHLGITPQAYGKIERGESNVTLEKLEVIANYLNVDVDFIRNFDETFIFSNITNTKGCVGFNNQYQSTDDNSEVLKVLMESVLSLKEIAVMNNKLLTSLISVKPN